jgi:TP901 family phage tail tape measure protein
MARKIEVVIAGDTRGLERSLVAAGRSVDGFGTRGSRLGHILGTSLKVGAYAAAGGVVALGYGMAKAITSAGDFQKQLNILQAVSGATASQMKAIQAESIALGKDMKLPATSASDAAVAMTELAKGGLSVKDSMHAARGALELAVAGQTDVATAASIAATSLNQFNLSGRQGVYVADLLANAANASAGDVVDFAEGLKYAGTSANAAGQKIAVVVGALAEMANKGLAGSVAGSSLAQALRALQAPSAKASDEMKKFGLNIYDATGKMKPLDQIANIFSDHLGHLTQKTQNQTLATIFGSRAIQAARVVFLGGGDALDKYTKRVSETGGAQRLAAAQMKGFSGAIQGFTSNIETLGIELGLVLLPAATAVIRKLSDLVTVLGNVANAKTPSIAFQIAWQGVGRVYDSLKAALFGETQVLNTSGVSKSAAHGIQLPVRIDKKGLVPQMTAAIAEGVKSVDWGAVGHVIATNFAAALSFTSTQAGAIVGSLVSGIEANHNQIADAGAQIAAELVAQLLNPSFWIENWKTAASIALAVIPVGKFGEGGLLIGRALLRPIAAVLERFLPKSLFFVETLFRSGFKRIGESILNYLRGSATRFPTYFNRAFVIVEGIAVGIFRAISGRVGGIISSMFSRAENEGEQAFQSIGSAVLRAAAKVLVFVAKVGLIRAAINGVLGIFHAIANAIDYIIQKVKSLAGQIASIHAPSLNFHLPSLPGFASGGVVPGPVGRPMVAVVHGGETVTPPQGGGGGDIYLTLDLGEGITKRLKIEASRTARAIQAGSVWG